MGFQFGLFGPTKQQIDWSHIYEVTNYRQKKESASKTKNKAVLSAFLYEIKVINMLNKHCLVIQNLHFLHYKYISKIY